MSTSEKSQGQDQRSYEEFKGRKNKNMRGG